MRYRSAERLLAPVRGHFPPFGPSAIADGIRILAAIAVLVLSRPTQATTWKAVGDADFDAVVLRSTRPVLVEFWAPSNAPSQAVHGVLDDLATTYGEQLALVRLNFDATEATAKRFAVRGLPVVLVFDHGEVKERLVGALPREKYVAAIEALGIRPSPESVRDTEIVASTPGEPTTAAQIFEPRHLAPNAGNVFQKAILQFDLSGSEGGRWHVDIAEGRARIFAGAASQPNARLTISARDFVDMMMGRLDGGRAWNAGKLHLIGDTGTGVKMLMIFALPGRKCSTRTASISTATDAQLGRACVL